MSAPHPLGPLEPLAKFGQWIVVLRSAKAPCDYRNGTPYVDAHNRDHWTTYTQAAATAAAWGAAEFGIGFVLTADDPFFVVDVDGALDARTGQWGSEVQTYCEALPGTCVELSQSGRGLHFWGQGLVPPHTMKRTDLHIELYTEKRFVLLGSGERGDANGDMTKPCPGIAAFASTYFPPRATAGEVPDEGPCAEWSGPVDDDELLALAMRSRGAISAPSVFGGDADGPQGVTFAQLWNTDANALGRKWPADGRPFDASSADMSLAYRLAFWTGRDVARCERLMRRSALARDKWDMHPSYLVERTIRAACAAVREVYRAPAPKATATPTLAVCAAPGSVRLVRGDAVAIEPVNWLWNGYLPAGMLTIIGGAPGCGKTTIGLSLAATITRGGQWPDGSQCAAPGDVLVWSGEDLQSILAGRLVAMGADLSRVYFIDGIGAGETARAFDPGKDMGALEAMARQLPAPGLLIVDPIVSAVSGDGHKSNDVRRALQPIVDLAQHLGCAVLGITHFTKGTAGRDPVERITGSLAFGALARLVLAAAKVKVEEGGEPRRLFVRAKSNIGPDEGGFAYALDRVPVRPGVEGQRVRWLDALEGTARDMLAEAEGNTADETESSDRADMRAFVRDVLGPGAPVASMAFESDATVAGFKFPKVRKIAKEMGAAAIKTPGVLVGGWAWKIIDAAKWARSVQGLPHRDSSASSHSSASSNFPEVF